MSIGSIELYYVATFNAFIPECSEGPGTINTEVTMEMATVMELYFTLYHGCYVRVLLLSSHEWIMSRYWTSVVIAFYAIY